MARMLEVRAQIPGVLGDAAMIASNSVTQHISLGAFGKGNANA